MSKQTGEGRERAGGYRGKGGIKRCGKEPVCIIPVLLHGLAGVSGVSSARLHSEKGRGFNGSGFTGRVCCAGPDALLRTRVRISLCCFLSLSLSLLDCSSLSFCSFRCA